MRTLLHAPRSRRRSIAAATLGALALVGSLLVATPAQAINDTGTGGMFVPASGRALDTLKGVGGYSTPMPANTWRTVKITGLPGIPDDGSVGAVSLNVTSSGTTDYGTVFGRPDADTSRTMMMIYNGNQGEYVSNSAVVAVSPAGTIQVQTETAARLILDVQGYYTANTDGTAAGGFVPVAGKRIVDTRSGLGTPKALLAPGKSVDIQVTGANGVPAGASAAVVNLLPINTASADGYLTPYATGTTRPANALHYAPSANTSIQAQVPLSSDGKMTIYNGSSTANLVIDLQGYFTAAGTDGATFTPGVGRVFNSRAAGSSILAKNETRAIPVAGTAGVPVMGSGISAVVLTLTALHGGSDGRASVWPNGTTQPDTTSINFQTDEIRTNTVTVALGANGKINLNNVADPTNYVIDVQGWYANSSAPTITCPEPYTNGGWDRSIPGSEFDCTVFAPQAVDSSATLLTTLDGEEYDESELSAEGSTTIPVTFDAESALGSHTLTATLTSAGRSTTRTYQFGTGDWAASSLAPSLPSGSESVMEPNLQVLSETDVFPPTATATYRLYATENASSPLETKTLPVTDSWHPDAKLLVSGSTYFWTATVQGSSGGRSSSTAVTSDRWSFKPIADPEGSVVLEMLPSDSLADIFTRAADEFGAARTADTLNGLAQAMQVNGTVSEIPGLEDLPLADAVDVVSESASALSNSDAMPQAAEDVRMSTGEVVAAAPAPAPGEFTTFGVIRDGATFEVEDNYARIVFETHVGKLPTAKVTDRIDYEWRVDGNKVKSPLRYRATYGKNGGYFTGITYKSYVYTVTGIDTKTQAGATTTRASRLNHFWESSVKSKKRLNGKRLQYMTQFNFKHGTKSSSQRNYSGQAQCDTSKYNNCSF